MTKCDLLIIWLMNCFIVTAAFGQVQVGNIIYGNPEDQAGSSVAISQDGSIIAVGSTHTYSEEGSVAVYELQGGTWVQKGSDITSVGPEFGRFVSLSADGNILVASSQAYPNYDWSGKVSVYEFANGDWSQLGADIIGNDGDQDGKIDISGDGSRIIIGGYQNSSYDDLAGHAKVYEYTNGSWSQLGQELTGNQIFHYFGYSVAISSDGNRIAVGAIDYVGPGANRGYARVYEWNGSTWSQMGPNFLGDDTGDWTGYDVDLNETGDRFILGSIRNDEGHGSGGQVKVFEWIDDEWIQMGDDIFGNQGGERLGWRVSMSNDGNKLGIASKSSYVGTNSGRAQYFEWQNNEWTKVGSQLTGVMEYDWQTEMELSGNGEFMIVGGWLNDDNGTDAGRAFVVDTKEIVCDSISVSNDLAGPTLRNILECAQNGDTIHFSSLLVGDTLILDAVKGPILIEDSITIMNEHAQITIDAQQVDRFCTISAGGSLSINNLKVLGGTGNPYCIQNEGSLYIDQVIFTKGDQSQLADPSIQNEGMIKVSGDSQIEE